MIRTNWNDLQQEDEAVIDRGMTPEGRTVAGRDRPASATRVWLLNHRRDPCRDLLEGLRAAGLDARESPSLPDTTDLLASLEKEPETPTVAVLNALSLKPDGIEAELLQNARVGNAALPVIILVDGPLALREADALALPVRDYLVKPHSVEELIHRVGLAVNNLREFNRLRERTADLEGQISVDAKTGLLSEVHFRSQLESEFGRAKRHRLPLSLALVDVDNFKGINDSTEYAFGDEVLRGVARVLESSTRNHDLVARFGGDEFVLLLPHTTQAEAVNTALRICKSIAGTVFRSGSYHRQVTVSIGIDSFDGRTEMTTEELRRRANKALHEAKRRGKNKVWLYSERPVERAESPE